ncbi:MAG TPA: hypothetical protein VG817_06150, partial [Gemmatimonadales bacterium]|nr:hypothetical protein [Gemmatimonadales bacterium]
MPWSYRSVSTEEKAALLGTFGDYPKSSRQGCISNLAHYGAHIVLIPMMGGGFLGAVLKVVGLPENPAYLIGVALAGMASLLIFRRNRTAEARFRESWERRRQAVQAIDA